MLCDVFLIFIQMKLQQKLKFQVQKAQSKILYSPDEGVIKLVV